MIDLSVSGALIAGFLSFLSPCILPIVPFYLSYLAGVGINQISEDASISASVRLRAVVAAIIFSLGIITVFVGLGASATFVGGLVRDYFDILRWAAAAVIVAMGLHFLGLIKISILYRQLRVDQAGSSKVSLGGAYLFGLAFAFGWTPCVGPVLAAILFTAAGQESTGQGALLLFIYGTGMTLPFVLAAFFIGPFMKWLVKFRRHLGAVEKVMGIMLIMFGLLIATNSMNFVAQLMLDFIPWFQTIG